MTNEDKEEKWETACTMTVHIHELPRNPRALTLKEEIGTISPGGCGRQLTICQSVNRIAFQVYDPVSKRELIFDVRPVLERMGQELIETQKETPPQ